MNIRNTAQDAFRLMQHAQSLRQEPTTPRERAAQSRALHESAWGERPTMAPLRERRPPPESSRTESPPAMGNSNAMALNEIARSALYRARMFEEEGGFSYNVATVPLDKARAYAEKQFSKSGKELDKELPDFDKNYVALQKACKKALDVPRIEMPVIEPSDMEAFDKKLTTGSIDIMKPFARGKLDTPKSFSGNSGSEWVKLGFADGDKDDDRVPARWTSKEAKTLLPTQSQIWLEKLVKNIIQWGVPAQGSPVTKATLIVSKEGYILDGHHRYGQAMLGNPKLKMKSLFIPLDIKRLLKIGRSYGAAIGNKQKG